MKRFVIAAVAWLAVVAASAAPVGAAQPRAQVQQFDCQRAISPVARAISVKTVMRPLSGTVGLEIRFDLSSKSKSDPAYSPVTGGDLGRWISPKNATLGQRPADVWMLTKQVADLAAPAVYRMQVSFRWLGDHDRVLGTAVRVMPACYQPELRPDLLVQSIVVEAMPRRPAMNRYVATIVNGGATAAGPFTVLFAPGGGLPVTTRSEAGLNAHGHLQEAFVGPACSTTSATTVTVDPAGAVDDFNRANNQLTAVCPAPAAP